MVMASAAFFSDAKLSPGERENRSNRWILLPLLVVGLLSSFLSRIDRHDVRVGFDLSFGSGVILAALTIPPILARIRSEEALHNSATNTIATGGAPRGSLRQILHFSDQIGVF